MIRIVRGQNAKRMTVAEYLSKQNILLNTLFIIKPTGESVFIHEGREVENKEFRRMFALPFSLVTFNGKEGDADGRRNWLTT